MSKTQQLHYSAKSLYKNHLLGVDREVPQVAGERLPHREFPTNQDRGGTRDSAHIQETVGALNVYAVGRQMTHTVDPWDVIHLQRSSGVSSREE